MRPRRPARRRPAARAGAARSGCRALSWGAEPLRRSFDFVYFSCVDWDYTRQRPQQLAARLARQGRVLYLDPLGLRPPRLSDVGRVFARLTRRTSASGAALPGGLTRSAAPLFHLPFPGNALAARVNGRILRGKVDAWAKNVAAAEPVVWVSTPSPAVRATLAGLPRKLLVYDCLDDFAEFHGDRWGIAATERELAAHADVVLATSGALYDKMRALNSSVRLVRNGGDYEHFSQAALEQPCPAPLFGLATPILGYFGEIADWFDSAAVRELALKNPACSVVLIGPRRRGAASALAGLSNVRLLGRRRYEELPRYLAHFDVCLLPFKVTRLTTAAHPVKLYEYLASGKPIVSSPLQEVLAFRDVVTIAERGDFSAAVRTCLERQDEGLAARQKAVARENTWDRRVEDVLRIVAEAVERIERR